MTFADTADCFFADFFRHYPVHATDAGNHEHDDRWPDLTDAGRRDCLAFLADARERLEALDAAELSRDEAIDRRVLLAQIDALRFDEEELDELGWNAVVYTYLFGGGLFSLLSREFAPLADRLRSAAGRMEGLPAALGAARANLTAGGARAVSRFHVEKAIETMPGVADLSRTAAGMAVELEDADLRTRVERAAETAVKAVDGYSAWMRDELLLTANGDFRLGRDLYERKFRHALKSTITPDELERRAAAAYDEVRAEMLRIARELWPRIIGEAAMPEDGDQLIRRVLDEIAKEHPRADELLDFLPRRGCHDRGLRSRARPHRPRRRPARHHLDPAVPARLRRRDAHSAGAAGPRTEELLRHHARTGRLDAGAGRVEAARGQQPLAAHPRHPRGGSRPLPPAGLVEPMRLAASGRLRIGRLRGRVGGVRDPGDDGRRLRRR